MKDFLKWCERASCHESLWFTLTNLTSGSDGLCINGAPLKLPHMNDSLKNLWLNEFSTSLLRPYLVSFAQIIHAHSPFPRPLTTLIGTTNSIKSFDLNAICDLHFLKKLNFMALKILCQFHVFQTLRKVEPLIPQKLRSMAVP